MAVCGLPQLVITLFSAVAAATVAAQQLPRGVRIIDQKGAAVPLAEITINLKGRTLNLLSDEEGHVVLDPALWQDSRTIHLDVSAVGFANTGADLDTQAADNGVIRLQPAAADGGDIVVVARKISRPFSPQTLSFLEIVTDPKAQVDPILAVNNLPASTNVTGSSRLTFRGSRAAVNRAYLNDTPVYEFSTGSELDSSTENRSIFGLVVADEVETYPGNPPTYLAGATGGVVRVVTPDHKYAGNTVSVTDLGLSGGSIIASKSGNNFVALYSSLTDLTLFKAINPDLKSLYGTIRSASGGAFTRFALRNGGAINFLVQAQAADNSFPFTIYGAQSNFQLRPVKQQSVVSASIPLSGFVLNASAAFTHSAISEIFGGSHVDSTNNYGFASLNLARSSLDRRLQVRAGFDAEYIRQVSDAALTIDGNQAAATAVRVYKSNLQEVTAYVFASYRQSSALAVSIGARHTAASDLRPGFSLQSSVTLTSADRQHKLILSAGRYSGAAVPSRAYYGAISRSTSYQAEADYSWTLRNNVIGFAPFYARERSYGEPFAVNDLNVSTDIDNLTGIARLTESRGLEAYATWTPISGLEAKASFATVQQSIHLDRQQIRGTNDYPSIIRASLRYSTMAQSIYSLSFTQRTGEPYTPAVGVTSFFGSPAPVFGQINGERLPVYLSLDASASRRVHVAHLSEPLVFVGLSNLTNRRNPSSQTLTLPGVDRAFRYLAGRSLVFGITANF